MVSYLVNPFHARSRGQSVPDKPRSTYKVRRQNFIYIILSIDQHGGGNGGEGGGDLETIKRNDRSVKSAGSIKFAVNGSLPSYNLRHVDRIGGTMKESFPWFTFHSSPHPNTDMAPLSSVSGQ